MGYRTRYFPPLSIETNQLPDNVVTEDKINPGAVTSEQIKDGNVTSDDLAANAVTSVKISAGAVTSDKIATGAVTNDKLSTTLLTRPLVPAITTDEIAEGAVTASKMASSIIDTAQLVDGAVTTDKIDPAAVTSSKLGVNSVTTTAIANGAVGEDELGTDSVTLAKIKDSNVGSSKIADLAVTDSKLAKKSLPNFLRDNPILYDDFVGAALSDQWAASGDAPGVADIEERSSLTIATGPAINDAFRINHNGVKGFRLEDIPILYTQSKFPDLTNMSCLIGFKVSATEYIWFSYDSSIDANWHAITRNGGAITNTDTAIPASSSRQQLRIEYISATDVKFYIGDALVATHTTNVPDLTDNAEPEIEMTTLENVAKEINLDYVIIDYARKT